MSEIWDCYDSQFNLVEGKVLIRGQEATFSEEEYHLVCDITVKHTDGTYLLMQRDFRKEGYPGKWEFTAGGSALQGESPEDGETIDYRWVGKSELLKMKEELATWRVFEMLPELEILPESFSTDKIEWLFFDVGSTLLNEEKANLHRLQDVAETVNEPFEKIYEVVLTLKS